EDETLSAQRAEYAKIAAIKDPTGAQVEQQIKANAEIKRIDEERLTLAEKRKGVEQDTAERSLKAAKERREAEGIRAAGVVTAADDRLKAATARLEAAKKDRPP